VSDFEKRKVRWSHLLAVPLLKKGSAKVAAGQSAVVRIMVLLPMALEMVQRKAMVSMLGWMSTRMLVAPMLVDSVLVQASSHGMREWKHMPE
jgi:hypothetical protein